MWAKEASAFIDQLSTATPAQALPTWNCLVQGMMSRILARGLFLSASRSTSAGLYAALSISALALATATSSPSAGVITSSKWSAGLVKLGQGKPALAKKWMALPAGP